MSPTLTGRAPLRIPGGAEVVASARGWHLALAHAEPDGRRRPKYYLLDRRRCLELLLAVRRAWWRIEFQRTARALAPGARMGGLYVSSELVEVRRDLLGDHVRVLGTRLRRRGAVRAFRRGLIASMRLGRRLAAELARGGARLAWPAAGAPPAAAGLPAAGGLAAAAPALPAVAPAPAEAAPSPPRPLADRPAARLLPRPAAPPAGTATLLLPTAARPAAAAAAAPLPGPAAAAARGLERGGPPPAAAA